MDENAVPHEWMALAGEPTVASLGENAVLARIVPRLPASSARRLGPGDDAAVVAVGSGSIVVTTDTLVAGPDFRLTWSSPFDLGWKAVAVNVADIAAMGARPTALVVALAVPAETPVRALEQVADGMSAALADLAPGCGVEGGDLARSSAVTVAVTAFGELDGREPVRRDGARPGDVVAVAVHGLLGWAAEGLRTLAREGRTAATLADPAVAAQLRPKPVMAAGVAAAVAGATAMLDVSDGLARDARRIAEASGVVIDLESALIGGPEVVSAGEDHALLATFPPSVTLPSPFRRIGRVRATTEQVGAGVAVDGAPISAAGGWDSTAGQSLDLPDVP